VRLVVEPSTLAGTARVPGSKSHTIRALAIASMAKGVSQLRRPLDSLDTRACVGVCRGLGAKVKTAETWAVEGFGGQPTCPEDVLDVANSGTTLRVGLGMAALGQDWAVFTGDEQVRSRPSGPLLEALEALGARAFSTRGNGRPPIVVRGPLRGGKAEVACPTSQYLSSLLLACPLAQDDSEIVVTELNERPYVEMTLAWLDSQGIRYEREGFERFIIPGGQAYKPFEREIPGDYSSATFLFCAAAVTGSEIKVAGLDPDDTQGDKAVLDILAAMGAEVRWEADGVVVRGRELRGGDFDLNATPDALPALAATACFASGTTRLLNVPQARIKETDRIAVMHRELAKMGGRLEELPDGLVVTGTALHGAAVDGHGDHRVVMALALAGLGARGRTEVAGAEAAAVTFPEFVPLLQGLGARITQED